MTTNDGLHWEWCPLKNSGLRRSGKIALLLSNPGKQSVSLAELISSCCSCITPKVWTDLHTIGSIWKELKIFYSTLFIIWLRFLLSRQSGSSRRAIAERRSIGRAGPNFVSGVSKNVPKLFFFWIDKLVKDVWVLFWGQVAEGRDGGNPRKEEGRNQDSDQGGKVYILWWVMEYWI